MIADHFFLVALSAYQPPPNADPHAPPPPSFAAITPPPPKPSIPGLAAPTKGVLSC